MECGIGKGIRMFTNQSNSVTEIKLSAYRYASIIEKIEGSVKNALRLYQL